MVARALAFGGLAVPCLLAGCITPWNTRMPTVEPSHPAVERRSFQVHDPFPEEDLGPDTMVRPREFREPRELPRRAVEGRSFLGMPAESAPVGPAFPPTTQNYPHSVPQ